MSNELSELYNPDLIFLEDTDNHRAQLAMDFKLYQIAKDAMEKKLTLNVITTDENFIGEVTNIDVKDENHLIYFENCRSTKTGEFLSQRQYFTFDILQLQEKAEHSYPDSDFTLLSNPSQIEGLTDSQDLQSQEILQVPSSQEDDSQQQTPFDNPPIYHTPDFDYPLPIQQDGSVDRDFLKLTWKAFDPSAPTFHLSLIHI